MQWCWPCWTTAGNGGVAAWGTTTLHCPGADEGPSELQSALCSAECRREDGGRQRLEEPCASPYWAQRLRGAAASWRPLSVARGLSLVLLQTSTSARCAMRWPNHGLPTSRCLTHSAHCLHDGTWTPYTHSPQAIQEPEQTASASGNSLFVGCQNGRLGRPKSCRVIAKSREAG